jgi:hypothetical protein
VLISEIEEKLCEHISEKQKLGCVVSVQIDDFLERNDWVLIEKEIYTNGRMTGLAKY